MAENGSAIVAPSSFDVPDWAVVTSASQAAEATVMNIPAAGTGAHSLEDSSLRTYNSNHNSDQKGGRLSALKNAALLPMESASGARPSPSSHKRGSGQVDQDVEKGGVSNGGMNDTKSGKRANTNEGSPIGSRQHSVVPEMPAEWAISAGIKGTALSDSTSSCCVMILRSGDDTKGEGVPLCSRAWWHGAAHSTVQEIRKVLEVVRARPLVLLPGLAVLGIVLGLGLWALIAASNAEEKFRHDSATKIAQDKAMYIQTELDKTFMPAYVVSTTVQQNPFNYYPEQPRNVQPPPPNAWYLEHPGFDKLSRDLIALTKAGSVRTVSIIPHGIIRTMYPLLDRNDRNWNAIGKNWLNDSANDVLVKLSLSSHNLTIIGPYNLTQGGIGIVGMQAIFVNASKDETFNIPPGPNNVMGPTSPLPGMMDLIYQPSYTAAPRFWGLCTVLLSWDFLRDNVTNLQDLAAQGYDYVLTRPDKGGTNLAVDWSPRIDPPRPPGHNATLDSGDRPLMYYDLPGALEDPVIVKVPLPNVEWTLYVSRTGGWVPSWKGPLIAMVVILSVVLSLLVFAVLVSRLQQRRLLRDVVEAAGKLASTSRTLEEEKNRMQALLARHFDLIDLLEGGTGRLGASLQVDDGGGSGGGGGDSGARSRIDILRQKMLLTGTSLRREQLGEAEQVTIQEMLGEGTFGKVYKGLWRGTEVAIKTIVLPAKMSGKEKREKMAVMEAAISSSLAHPNVVQTYTYHIRPLRDSSAPAVAPALAPPSPPEQGGGNGTSPAAVGSADTSGGPPAVAAAGGSNAVGQTQILADAGAIVMGSPDTSVSTASPSLNNTAATTHAAAASGNAPGAGSAAPTPEAATAATGTGTGVVATARTPSQSARGVSMDQPSSGGIHSYEVQLVLEYCDRGCLRDALDAGAFFSAEGLNYPAILETAADIAKAMLHLHLNDVLHSDLKATNVMLKSTGSDSGRGIIAKVADFGLSVRLDHAATHISHAFQGSLTHMAPEVMLQGHVSRAADVYAFGITLWEIFTGGQPYRGTPGALLGHQTSKEGRRPVFPLGTPAAYRELAERCWAADAAARPPFSEILDLLTQMRVEIPGPTALVQTSAPLAKKMAAALAQQRQPKSLGHSGNAAGGGGDEGGGDGGAGGGTRGSGGSLGGSSVGTGIATLPKIGGPAAILVGGRLVSLSSAMHSADSGSTGGRMLPGNSAAAGGTLTGLGFPGVLETICEGNEQQQLTTTATTTANSGQLLPLPLTTTSPSPMAAAAAQTRRQQQEMQQQQEEGD